MYNLKDTVSPTDRYLGANVGKWQFSDGSNYWWMNGRDFIANAINLAKKLMDQKGKVIVYGKQAKRPMLISYTFRFITKSSLLKVLYTLALLC